MPSLDELLASQNKASELDKLLASQQQQEADSAQSKANIAEDTRTAKLSGTEGGAGQPWEIATPFGRINTGIKKSGTVDRTLAGIGSGLTNMAQSAGNMMGLVDDETLMERKKLDAPLSDTTAGSVGQIIGETAALAPLGTVRLAGALPGVSKALAPIASKLNPTMLKMAPAIAEGGAAGALLANPNERGSGAAKGAAMGTLLERSMAGISRLGKDGLAKMKPEATELIKYIEKATGKRPFIPTTLAADKSAGSLTSKSSGLMDAIGLMKSARDKMGTQVDDLADDSYHALLKNAFRGGDRKGTVVTKVLDDTNDLEMAMDAARASLKGKGGATPTQSTLYDAASGKPRGRFDPKDLLKSTTRTGKNLGTEASKAPLRSEAIVLEKVFGEKMGASTVQNRDMYHSLGNALAIIPDSIPLLGDALASKKLQQFILGDLKSQRLLRDALATKSGGVVRRAISDVRRMMSAQPALQDESIDLANTPQEYIEALRGAN